MKMRAQAEFADANDLVTASIVVSNEIVSHRMTIERTSMIKKDFEGSQGHPS
jgi:hypothetical protein